MVLNANRIFDGMQEVIFENILLRQSYHLVLQNRETLKNHLATNWLRAKISVKIIDKMRH